MNTMSQKDEAKLETCFTRSIFSRYQDCSRHNEEALVIFLILSRRFILFDLNNDRGCMSKRLDLKSSKIHSQKMMLASANNQLQTLSEGLQYSYDEQSQETGVVNQGFNNFSTNYQLMQATFPKNVSQKSLKLIYYSCNLYGCSNQRE